MTVFAPENFVMLHFFFFFCEIHSNVAKNTTSKYSRLAKME